MDLRTELCLDLEALEPHRPGWDALAVVAGVPMAAPAFALGWWEAASRPPAAMRVVVAQDEDGLVGVAPFVLLPGPRGIRECRLMGGGIAHRLGPAVRPGHERRFGAAVARALAEAPEAPDVVIWEGVDAATGGHVVGGAAEAWPTRFGAQLRRDEDLASPVVSLAGLRSHDEWLATKSKNFRHKERQLLKAGRRAGLRVRRTQRPDELGSDLAHFARLHDARWADRGGSSTTSAATLATFAAMGSALLASGRLWLYLLERDGATIGAYLAVGAGAELTGVAVGFDDAHPELKPGHQLMHAIIGDACAQGVDLFDLGGGAHPYKIRFADAERELWWRSIYPIGPRWPGVRRRLARRHLRQRLRRALRRLPDERHVQAVRVLHRLPGWKPDRTGS